MPFEDRNHYNRMHLTELQQANHAEIERLRAAHPDWAAGDAPFLSSKEWESWKTQWDNANQSRLGYEQVQRALESPDGLPRLLATVDGHEHAAVAINNPDTAKRTATFVPGTGQDLTRLEFSTAKSEQCCKPHCAQTPASNPVIYR